MPTDAVLFPSCSSLTKRNHTLAQLVALLMYLHLIWQLGEQIKPQKQLHFHQMQGRRHLFYQFGHRRQTYLHINIYVFPGPRRVAFMQGPERLPRTVIPTRLEPPLKKSWDFAFRCEENTWLHLGNWKLWVQSTFISGTATSRNIPWTRDFLLTPAIPPSPWAWHF